MREKWSKTNYLQKQIMQCLKVMDRYEKRGLVYIKKNFKLERGRRIYRYIEVGL